jgi:hypothetical protein
VVVQDPLHCFPEIPCDVISIVFLRLEANEFLPPQACQDEDGTAARSQASRDITEGIADHVGSGQVQVKTLRRLEEESRLRLATGAILIGSVGTAKDSVDPPSFSVNSVNHPSVDLL